MAVSETLQLDVRQALSNIDQLDRRMTQATSNFKTGLATATQQLKVNVDSKQVDEARGKTQALTNDVGVLGGTAETVGKKWSDSLKAMALGAIGLGVAVQVFKTMISEALEAEKVTAQVNQVIKSTGSIAGVTADHVNDLANAESAKIGVDDEVIARGAALLLTFTKVRNEVGKGNDVFDRGVRAAEDMSAAMGEDLQGSIIRVGKALQDPITGFTALRRVGVALTDQQKESIKTFVAQGDTLSAQKLILNELETEFGGTAAAIATDSEKASVNFKNFQENAGKQLLPFVNAFLEAGVAILGVVDDLGGLVAVAPAVAAAILVIAGAVQEGFPWLAAFGFVVTGLVSLFAGLQQATFSLTAHLNKLVEGMVKADAATAKQQFDKYAAAAAAAAEKLEGLGVKVEGSTTRLKIFNDIAAQNPAIAARIIEGMAAAGQNTDKYTEALNKSIANQKLGAEFTEKLRQANVALSGSYEEQLALINETSDALAAQYDKQFAAMHANEQARDAIDQSNAAYEEAIKAGKGVAEAEEARARATTSAEEAALKSAQAAGQLAQANYTGTDASEAARLGTEAQKAELERLMGTMAPDSPLRVFLQEYLNKLNEIPPTKGTDVSVNTGDSIPKLNALEQAAQNAADALKRVKDLGGAAGGGGGGSFAGGGQIFPAARGRQAFFGGAFLVGEQGMELFRPTTPGTIVPHPATMGLLGGTNGGTSFAVTINVTGAVDPRTARRVGEEAGNGFVDAVTRRRLSVAARTG